MKNSKKNDLDFLLNLSFQEAISSLDSDLSNKKIKDLLAAVKSKNDFINELFIKLRKLGLFVNDVENNKVFPNDLWYGLGYNEEDMLNLGFLKLVHPDDLEKVMDQSVLPCTQGKDVNRIIFRIRSKDGSWHWLLSSTVSVTTDSKGYIKRYVGFDYDITQEMETKVLLEKALVQAHDAREEAEANAIEANTLREVSSVITSSLDLEEVIKAILEQAKRVVPYDNSSVQILKGNKLEVIGGEGWKEPEKVIGVTFPVPGDNPNTVVMETREPLIIKNNTDEISCKLDAVEYSGGSWIGVPLVMRGEVIGMMTFAKREENFFNSHHIKLGKTFASHVAVALENARIYEEVKELASKDPLTGAHNRRSFFEFGKQQEKLFKRYGTNASILMLDIDHFKKFNDDFGHQAGDDILSNMVDTIEKRLRDSDFLCRYGGEEFVILLPQSDESEAYEIAERIRRSVKSNLKIEGINKRITVSLGCADFNTTGTKSIDSLISLADKALYFAKSNGRDCSKCYSEIVDLIGS